MPRTTRRRALGAVDPNTVATVEAGQAAPHKPVVKDADVTDTAHGLGEKLTVKKTTTPARVRNAQRVTIEKQKAELEKKDLENEALKAQIAELTRENAAYKLSESQNEVLRQKSRQASTQMQELYGAKERELVETIEENLQLKATIANLSERTGQTNSQADSTESKQLHAQSSFNYHALVSHAPAMQPKRPKAAFAFFCAEHREGFKETHPEISVKEVTSHLKAMWDSMDAAEAAPFQQKALDDRIRYETEKAEYQKKRASYERACRAMEWMKEETEKEMAMKLYEQSLTTGTVKVPQTAASDSIPIPKQARTAWNFFQKHYREVLKEKNSGENLSFSDLSSQVAAEWNRLQKSKKKKDKDLLREMDVLAEGDRERHASEMKEYNFQIAQRRKMDMIAAKELEAQALQLFEQKEKEAMFLQEGKMALAAKEQAAREEKQSAREERKQERILKAAQPKGARSAYNFFMKDMVPVVREKDGLIGKDAFPVISNLWKEANKKTRAKYQAMADQDKERYISESQVGSDSASVSNRTSSEQSSSGQMF